MQTGQQLLHYRGEVVRARRSSCMSDATILLQHDACCAAESRADGFPTCGSAATGGCGSVTTFGSTEWSARPVDGGTHELRQLHPQPLTTDC